MKKVIAIIIAVVMIIGLVACAAPGASQTSSDTATASAESEATKTETTESGKVQLDGTMDASNNKDEFKNFGDYTADLSGDRDREPYQIGCVFQELTNDFFANTLTGVEDRCKERNVELLSESPGSNASEEIRILENLQSMGVNAIITAPVNNVSADDYQKALVEDGIPVINYCFQTNHHTSEISCDNYHDGELYAEMVAKYVKNTPELANKKVLKMFVYDILTLDSMHARCMGIKDRILELLPNAQLVETEMTFTDIPSAYTIAENVLLTDPDTDLFLPWCDIVAVGCVEALENAGLDGDDVTVFGDDGIQAALELMAKDKPIFKGTMYYDVHKMGEQLVDLAIAAIEGEELSFRYYYIDPEYVTPENVQEYLAKYNTSTPAQSNG